MEKIGFIEIRITGSKGNLDLSPENYDIREIITMLENAEKLLYPGDKSDRPTISYKIEEGSVKHILKTSIQYIIGFNAIIGQVNKLQNIDFLDLNTARSFENIQDIAAKKNYIFSIKTSPRISTSFGGFFAFNLSGIVRMVLIFEKTSSPVVPSPLVRAPTKIPFS